MTLFGKIRILINCPLFRNPSSFPFQCEDCQKRFVSLEKLQTHYKYKYRTCERFQCQHCALKFTSALKLSRHAEESHQDIDEPEQEVPVTVNKENDIDVVLPSLNQIDLAKFDFMFLD